MRSFDQSLGSIASASESRDLEDIGDKQPGHNHYPAHRSALSAICVHVCADESRELFLIVQWILSTARNVRLPPTCTI